MVRHAQSRSLPPLKSERASRGASTLLQGNPVLLFHLGGRLLRIEATRIERLGSAVKISGFQRGKFSNENILILIWLHRASKNSALTNVNFGAYTNEGGKSLQNRPKRLRRPLKQNCCVGGEPTIVALTAYRAESVGISLGELETIWGKTHGTPIIDREYGYICLHHRKEAR